MTQVSQSQFGRFLGKFDLVVGVNAEVPISNTNGRYLQKVYYSSPDGIEPDLTKPLASMLYRPSHNTRWAYFVEPGALSGPAPKVSEGQ